MKNNILTGFFQLSETMKRLFILMPMLFWFGSCDNFVDVDLPSGQLTSPAVFEDKATATAAMVDIYAKMRNTGLISGISSGLSNQMGNYADELVYYGATTASTTYFYNNSLVATHGFVSDWWSNSYNEIYAANAVIEGVTASTTLKPEDKNELKGEALFVRALLHFYLVNLYGDIPYITTTNYEENQIAGRMNSDAVYQHIIEDLTLSMNLLPENYLTSERIRPNKSAASALLARTYLYHGDWAEASNAASAVLNNALYVWDSNLDNIFLKESTTTIWQLKPVADGKNSDEGATFVFESGPPPLVALNEDLVNAFEQGDQRRIHWITNVTDGTTTWYHANKYKERGITASSVEYSVVLRLAEQYLIRAEARAQQGELISAKEDLNKIRNTAGLADTAATTQAEILVAIQLERRVELFTEEGHRFFDLKRTESLDALLKNVKPGWDSTDALLPVPESELLLNPNLAPQNLGY